MLLKIYSDPYSAPKVFDVSSVTMNSGFVFPSQFVSSLKKSQQFMSLQIHVTVLERMIKMLRV